MRNVIHKRRAFGGKTAEQYHSDHAFPPDAKCGGCKGLRPILRIIIMAPLDELVKRGMLGGMHPAALMPAMVDINEGSGVGKKYVRISTVYACNLCKTEAERAAAKAPSWCIVEINRGPGPDKLIMSG